MSGTNDDLMVQFFTNSVRACRGYFVDALRSLARTDFGGGAPSRCRSESSCWFLFSSHIPGARLYGFRRTIDEIKANSAWPIHWLSVENRNQFWSRMGEPIFEGWKFKLFPGLLPILFSVTALLGGGEADRQTALLPEFKLQMGKRDGRWVNRLDVLIVVAFAWRFPRLVLIVQTRFTVV